MRPFKLGSNKTRNTTYQNVRSSACKGLCSLRVICVIVALLCVGVTAYVWARAHIPLFMPTDDINEKTYQIFQEFDLGLAKASVPFYNEEGYVDREQVPALFDTIEGELQAGIESGVISSYSREDENDCIVIVYTSGMQELFMPRLEGVLAGDGKAKITTMNATFGNLSTTVNELTTNLEIKLLSIMEEEGRPYTGSLSVETCADMIVKAYPELYTYNIRNPFNKKSFLSNMPFVPTNILFSHKLPTSDSEDYTGLYTHSSVGLESFSHLPEAKVIIWEGHEGYDFTHHSTLVTRQVITFEDCIKYKDDFKDGSLLHTSSLSLYGVASAIDDLPGVNDRSSFVPHFVITPKYIRKHLGNMDHALVFLGACNSMRDNELAKAFMEKGADVVYGYSAEAGMGYEMATRTYLFYALSQGYSAGDAHDFATYHFGQSENQSPTSARFRACYSQRRMSTDYYLDGIRANPNSKVKTISTVDELDAVRQDLAGDYELIANLDLSGRDWTPLSDYDHPFTGTFEGNGYTISGLRIHEYSDSSIDAGLFGVIDGGSVWNLKLKNVDVLAQADNPEQNFCNVGALTGQLIGGTVSGCEVTGVVESQAKHSVFARAGALIGGTVYSHISNCHVDADVIAHAHALNAMAGGIVAWLDDSTVEYCLVEGSVKSVDDTSVEYVGGIAASGGNGIINNSAVASHRIEASKASGHTDPCCAFAKSISSCLVADDIRGNIPHVDYVTYCPRSTLLTREKLTEIGWDFSSVWEKTELGISLQ